MLLMPFVALLLDALSFVFCWHPGFVDLLSIGLMTLLFCPNIFPVDFFLAGFLLMIGR